MVKARQRAFLRVYTEVGNVTRAAAIVGVSRRIHYVWRERDPEYALELESARERAYDVLFDEAYRRAMGYRGAGLLQGCKGRNHEEVL